MVDWLFVDLTTDGRVTVSARLDGQDSRSVGESCNLTWPLDSHALEELRWYLEDYLRVPFGVYEDRGPRVATSLVPWGEAIFRAVFGSGAAKDVYQRVQRHRAGLQVVLRSDSAELLALPWELARDPAHGMPLALEVAGMDRGLLPGELDELIEVPGDRLRVLMVISRPTGAADVGFRMIARPLLERLAALRGEVELVVLRPPTLDALAAALAEAASAGKPFQVLHFDGHGALTDAQRINRSLGIERGSIPEGTLVFQSPSGGADPVSASRLGKVLAAAHVPLVVLNACQSGAVGKELEAAVATRLLREGATSVVAMAYSVYAVAAAEFVAAFYERLFAGDTVSTAMTAGRQRLSQHNRRPSPKGELPLADWLVPVHYARMQVRFASIVTGRPIGKPSLEAELDRFHDPGRESVAGDLTPVEGVFIGRDGLFYELESAIMLQRVVVLHGPAGTGKTELAKAFGRWWQNTSGVEQPDWVFWHSFEPGRTSFGIESVVTEIGLHVFGPDFVRLDDAERIGVVEGFLQRRRALLIWDNFESINSMPDQYAVAPRLDDEGRQNLSSFLSQLATAGRSGVLITSRSDEGWLDNADSPVRVKRIRIAGLLPEEATDYAGLLLAPFPTAFSRRAGRRFGELMEWLDGHPLSMRLVLPHLDSTDPAELLNGLQGIVPMTGWDDGQDGRVTSLAASIDYSFAHLSPAARRLLCAISLFRGIADADVLTAFSEHDSVPDRFKGVTGETWIDVLDAATQVGILTAIGSGMYRVHPALPAYLAAQWRTEDADIYEAQRATATLALLSAYAAFGGWLREEIGSGNAEVAYNLIDLQQSTMEYLLGYALDQEQWSEAQAIAQPLNDYWDVKSLDAEAEAWTDRACLAIGDVGDIAQSLDSPAGSLWLFFIGARANRQVLSRYLDKAESTYRKIMAMFKLMPVSSTQQKHLAAIYHQLGMIAQGQGRPDEAIDWYMKSLRMDAELDNRSGMASTYYQLGMVTQLRGQLDEAVDWYSQSLAITEQLGDRRGMGLNYHVLGVIAEAKGRLDEAVVWYSKAVAIEQELGSHHGMARMYHQLGILSQNLGRLDEAADWYARSLAIHEELGDRREIAGNYHQLGILAQENRRLDEAADWYARSLAIHEELGDRREIAGCYHQLGRIAQENRRLDEAADWYARSLAIHEEFEDKRGIAANYLQLGILAQENGRLDEAVDWYVRSLPINEQLGDRYAMALSYSQLELIAEEQREPAKALEWTVRCLALFDDTLYLKTGTGPIQLARLTHQLGINALEACWQRVTGKSLPEVLLAYVRSYPPGGDDAVKEEIDKGPDHHH